MRARLYDLKRSEAHSAQHLERQQQVGSGGRHERIRTYNFPQDRVTDHRVGMTINGIRQFMEGEGDLDTLLDRLLAQEEARNIGKIQDTHR